MGIDPRHLGQLAMIAECGSFSGAANRLNISQPALSSGIALLEARLGVRVLVRSRSGAKLTSEGEALIRHWRVISSHLDLADEEIKLKKINIDGRLTIGVTPVSANSYVPQALGELKKRAPNVAVSLVEVVHPDMLQMLRNHELDLAVGPIGIFPEAPEICEKILDHDELGLVVRADNKRYVKEAMTLDEVDDLDWILTSETGGFRRQLEAIFLTSGKSWPRGATTTNSAVSIKSLVRYSDGVTIMPWSMVALECTSGYLRHIKLEGIRTRRAIGYLWPKTCGLSPVALELVEILEGIFEKNKKIQN